MALKVCACQSERHVAKACAHVSVKDTSLRCAHVSAKDTPVCARSLGVRREANSHICLVSIGGSDSSNASLRMTGAPNKNPEPC